MSNVPNRSDGLLVPERLCLLFANRERTWDRSCLERCQKRRQASKLTETLKTLDLEGCDTPEPSSMWNATLKFRC
jgi:hypothetical protein